MKKHLSTFPMLLIGLVMNGMPLESASAQNTPRPPIAIVQKMKPAKI
jgi:hypothetical protein